MIGKKIANNFTLQKAALKVKEILADQDYLQGCMNNGLERMGKPGASEKIANYLVKYLS